MARSRRIDRSSRSNSACHGTGLSFDRRPQLQVLVDTAWQVPQAPRAARPGQNRKLLVGDPLQEVAVVRDDDQRAGPRVEQVFDRREHVGVEVVGRLVENQHVRLIEQNEQQLQSALLPAREVFHRGRELRAREPHAFEHLPRRQVLRLRAAANGEARAQPPDHHAHRLVQVLLEFVEALRQRRDLDGFAALHPPRGRFDRAGNEAQQRRLARTVDAENARALAWGEQPIDVFEHRAVAVRDARFDQVHDLFAEARHRQRLQLSGVANLGHVFDKRVRGVDAKLGFRGARRGPAAQPRELLTGEVLPLLLDRCGLAIPLDALQNVSRVAAFERLNDAVVHLPGRVRDLVEKPAIVRHREHRTLVRRPATLQVVGEPRNRLDVEVVRRFVEGEDLPLPYKQTREGDTASLSTAQSLNRRIPLEIGDKTREHLACARVASPLVLGHVADDRVPHGFTVVEAILLIEHADSRAAAHGHLTTVGAATTGKHHEQARLAVAVAADDADSVALGDAERD